VAEDRGFTALEETQRSKEALYRLGANLIKYRLPITILISLFTAFMAYQSFQIKMTTAFNDLLPYRHPFVQVHFKFADQFGGANNVNVMIKVDKDDVFTKEVLKKIFDMTQAMDRVFGVNHDQIASIGHRTTRYLTVLGGTIATPPVMRRPPKTDEEVEEIKKICYNTESIYGQLVSLDGKALLIKANFIEGRLDYKRIFDEIDRTVKQPFETSEHTIWIAGEPQLYGWIYHYANEVYTVFIAATLIAWLLLYFYFRDWRGALRPTITGVISAFWGLGMQSLMGFAMDPLALVIPFFVTARAVEEYRGDVAEAMRIGVATAGKAVTFTAFTLSLGAACWMFSNIRFCSEMGLLLALWMMISFLGSCTLVPALIVLMKPKFFLRAVEEGIVG
jgi:uncharacterized protein